jgi:hypothetical protein
LALSITLYPSPCLAPPLFCCSLVPLSTAIDIRTQFASRVFRDFNPPTMDEAQYMRLLEQRGFFANSQGGGYDEEG